ncbi:MAG: response regulator [Planctomycetota bacterium]
MKILVADDDVFSRSLLEAHLEKSGHLVVSSLDGSSAIKKYQQDPSIGMAILDWMMPGIDGLEVARVMRQDRERPFTYIIMLTSRSRPEDLSRALETGVDDFIAKPFNALELNARINVGARTIRLQKALSDHINDLRLALAQAERMNESMPMCPKCKRIGDDSGYWKEIEEHRRERTLVELDWDLCPDCQIKIEAAQAKI